MLFQGGKMEPYVKRCTSTRIFSAEKLMYICKSQLGIEKEYEQKVLPDGRLSIDGFIVVYDVSAVPGIDPLTFLPLALVKFYMCWHCCCWDLGGDHGTCRITCSNKAQGVT